LERIEKSAFRGSGLTSILIPSSVVVLGKGSFSECKSLESVTFESDSRLERIEESVFCESGLKSIEIPSSFVVLCESVQIPPALLSFIVLRGSPLQLPEKKKRK
jgi:hypothetical protein